MDTNDPLLAAVERLMLLLSEETDALRRLDHVLLDSLTERKVALLHELSTVPRVAPSPQALRAIAEMRERALRNQMLMVHARDLTQGMFDRMMGNPHSGKNVGGRLLEVRG